MTENEDDFDAEKAAQAAVGVLDKDWNERPRGMLSHDDRLFIVGMKDYEWQQSESNARRRVMDRIINGFDDFSLLRSLDQSEASKILAELGEDELHRRVSDLLTVVYQMTGRDTAALASMVESGVLHGENSELGGDAPSPSDVFGYDGGASNVDVSIQIDRKPDVEQIYERYKTDGERLTPKEIGVLVVEGMVGPEDLEDLRSSQ
ncbi:hypothetical protein C5B86_19705, partial [Haloferax sp. Atlit-19N]|uniref:hypothetical protein n=1 Tax=Haloferax sp. Atlit-19N TaxID=2077201 RepID=UPI000E3664DD